MTEDGARIRFDGRGYGLRSSGKYQTNLTLIFSTEDTRYEWLTKVVAVMEGDFDEKTGRRLGTFMPLLEAADRLVRHFSSTAPTARRRCAPNPVFGTISQRNFFGLLRIAPQFDGEDSENSEKKDAK